MTQEKLYKIIKNRIKNFSTNKDIGIVDLADSILFNINKHVTEVIGEDNICSCEDCIDKKVRNLLRAEQRKRAGL